jgi:membrane peptidoglycan carboxypeptidase
MLANDGIMVESRLYTSIRSADGDLLKSNDLKEDFIAPATSVFLINDILKGAIQRGTGIRIKKSGFNSEVAGKTGTSNNSRDTWFVGYTPRFLAAIWIGEKNNSSTGSTGGTLAAPVWADFMKCIDPSAYETPFIKPLDIQKVKIDLVTEKKASKFCPKENTAYIANQKQMKLIWTILFLKIGLNKP